MRLRTIHPQPRYRGLVDLNAEAGFAGQRDQSVLHRQRRARNIFGEIEMREADAPIDVVQRAGEMHRCGGAETGFRHLGGDVDRKAKTPAQRAGVERSCEAAELDEFERDAGGAGRRMRLDIMERMNALVGPDRSSGGPRERRKAFQVAIRERLLEEKKVDLPGRREVTPRRVIREAAIGIGADRHIRPQRLAHRKR